MPAAMDTPGLTPDTTASSSPVSSDCARSPSSSTLSQKPYLGFNTTAMDSYQLARSLRPLSPPESPFNFASAFSAPSPKVQPRKFPAPASPHFALPALVKGTASPPSPTFTTSTTNRPRTPESKKQQRNWNLHRQKFTQDNPYFPSLAQQEHAARWSQDASRLPRATPVELSGAAGGADPSSHVTSAASSQQSQSQTSSQKSQQSQSQASSSTSSWVPSPSSASSQEQESDPKPAFKLDLEAARRDRNIRRAASSQVVATVAAAAAPKPTPVSVLPVSPGSLEMSSSSSSPPARAARVQREEAYRKAMVAHLQERMRRKTVRPTPWGKDDGFAW